MGINEDTLKFFAEFESNLKRTPISEEIDNKKNGFNNKRDKLRKTATEARMDGRLK